MSLLSIGLSRTLKYIENLAISVVEDYAKDKYKNSNSITVCIVYADKENIYFTTPTTKGGTRIGTTQPFNFIRKMVGDNVMNVYGFPPDGKEPSHVILYPTLSILHYVGISEYYKLLRDWPGQSLVGTMPVVRYSVWN